MKTNSFNETMEERNKVTNKIIFPAQEVAK